MKNILEEFKAFALKGNAMDLAVGVVIATAFGKIVTSLVDDIIMPSVGLLGSANLDFSEKTIGPVKIGMFINNVINLLIVSAAIFVAIKFLNHLTKNRKEN